MEISTESVPFAIFGKDSVVAVVLPVVYEFVAVIDVGVNVFVVVVPALGAVDWYPANALFICSITFLSLRSNVLPPFAFENDF